ncbi:transaldolase [Candidatus Nitrosacidococcus sp. I8]|uniref:transaldolase n=1 Tax=Candidatus Nitrosacidococcus sp. I8 TaxID=2942908 RepID=UPI00222605A0|nr:transaldolase [Candidatus Nitrosacidococcus sp. I8]CAH9018562.1 Transaldolase [Candidatus Nitrosacidococcus sp. I8]
MSSFLKLFEFGQSCWMDNLTRGMIHNGSLKRRVEAEGLRGVTSNPSIFDKAITGSSDYNPQIKTLCAENKTPAEVCEALMVTDIRDACDVLRPVYDKSDKLDGYVSLEVSPHLAHDTEKSLTAARRLWNEVSRPNLMIKIPGTKEGVPAIETLLYEGINVNVTLLFSVERYEEVAYASLRALERRVKEGKSIKEIASVASFFVSRIDVLIDEHLNCKNTPEAKALQGKMAIANAKLAYKVFKEIINNDRWKAVETKGAQFQRLLWASTSTKNPNYSDVIYVDPLIGPHTVNTMPENTMAAFADHGVAANTVEQGMNDAEKTAADIARLGINFKDITEQLEREGVQKFIEAYEEILTSLKKCGV